jgi:predicted kinase
LARVIAEPVRIVVPRGAMVVLIGASGAGKSTFAARHFPRTHVLSSDEMRAIVADDPNDQNATQGAFQLLHTALALRMAGRRTTVIDATNVERLWREQLLAIARRAGRPAIAIVLAQPLDVMLARNEARPDPRPPASIRRQQRRLVASIAGLQDEGYERICFLDSEEAVEGVEVIIEG